MQVHALVQDRQSSPPGTMCGMDTAQCQSKPPTTMQIANTQERAAAAAQRKHADELRAQMAANAVRIRAAREAARNEGAEGRARQAAHEAAIEARAHF